MSAELLDRFIALLRSSVAFARGQVEAARQDWPRRGSAALRQQQRFAAVAEALERVRLSLALIEAMAWHQQRHALVKLRREDMGEIINRRALFAEQSEDGCRTPLLDWPRLDQLGLGAKEASDRLHGIGGSDANIILSGDREKILALWSQKRGEQPRPDLSDNLAVMLGCWTEAFNRHWYEKISGITVEQVPVAIICTANPWRRCTLDGYLSQSDAIWEAKHTSAFSKPEEVLERYMPQLQHNMAVVRCERAVLSVIFGNSRFEIFEVASDWIYQIELLQAEADFWDCVQTGKEPVPACPPAPPKPVGVREVSLEGSNSWAAAAADWLENCEAAKVHAAACKTIKELVEPDVARAFGHGIEAKRSKSGAISIREIAQ